MSLHLIASTFKRCLSLSAFDSGPLPQISFTYFARNNDAQGTRYQNDWPALCAWIEQSAPTATTKDELPLIKLATFANDYRNNANVEMICGVEGDYDAEVMQPQEAAFRLTAANVIAFIYTSPSHTPEKPRWRVIAPTSQPRSALERHNLVGRINGILGGVLADESFTDSQSYYVGRLINGHRIQCFRVNGTRYIDTVESVITAPAKSNATVGRKPLGTDRAPDFQLATIALNSLDVNCDRNEWRDISFAFRHAVTGLVHENAARLVWDVWNAGFSKPNEPGANDKQWRSADNGTNFGWSYLRHQAIKSGNLTDDQRARMTLGGPSSLLTSPTTPETSQLSIFDQAYNGPLALSAISTALATSIREHLPIAFDTFKQRMVKRNAMPWDNEPTKNYPALWGDVDDAYLQSWFHHLALKPTMEAVRNASTIAAHRNKFNPVTDYLNSLRWDGASRINNLFLTYFNATNETFAHIVGSKFLISMVARAYNPGCKVDTVIVLEGEQGKQKSTALNILAGDDYFSDGLPDIHHKDAADHLQGLWLIEIGEMAAVKRSDIADVNRFLTTRIDKFRPSYGRHTIASPRTSVFAATTNADVYLKDPTGARRFWPIAVSNTIDLDGLRRDRDQLFAEAVSRYRQGEPHWLNEAEYEIAKRETSERQEEMHPWHNIVTAHLEFKNIVHVDRILSDILKLSTDKQTKSSEMEVAKIIRATKQFKRGEDHNRKRCWKRIAPMPMFGQ
ncbi:VapE family protein [Bradyrhizobium sp. SSUT112]|uniref:VapE domain-containing protein n=1 Tax=Bradyrhizobium sp. SSUT112 TaxID=3040604 RepID=UPI00244BC798|nr:VapE domain-containing protein [Bradyrhizobium sp. SSUT112]MDH2354492.1 VapE family protein [Bradyrhizobium sp. SSUT112]